MSHAQAIIAAGYKLAVPLISRFEGLRLQRYPDTQGVLTIGIGTTAAALGHPVPATCTYAQAEAWFIDTLKSTYAKPVEDMVEAGVPLTAHMFAALCSLSYNEGPGVFDWQIGIDLRNRDLKAASADFMRYVAPSVLYGRRVAERAFFDTPDTLGEVEPTDPNHYDWYPNKEMVYDEKHFDERRLARLIDEWVEHPKLYHGRLVEALPLMKAASKRIWVVSVMASPAFKTKREKPDWSDHRGWRYQQWIHRIAKVEKVIGV